MLQTLFRLEGYDVVAVETAEAGFRATTQLRPDAILVDGTLPDEDGLSLARRIRASDAPATDRVVFLAGHVTPALEANVREAGCDSLLLKPFDFARLVRTVRRLAVCQPHQE